ncbi:MAG: VCBS repeat-containing protein [Saprospiraceae bacterium]|nr:VCBS repeat-containing protein [Saprospiraceae bacterium]
MKNILLPALLILLNIDLDAQLEFTRGNSTYRPGKDHRSGVAGAITDVNGDLYDDLIVLHKSKVMEVGTNRGGGKEMKWSLPVNVSNSEEYALTAGDIDNDHIPEIAIGGIYSGSKFYKRQSDGSYTLQQNINKAIYTQSANMVDFDNNGFLDYFACNDEGNSLLARNINGQLSEFNLIDYSTIPPSDNSGNYGSEWADVDNDGDMDLYIAKCKFGITDPEDPRRHNMLFINQGGTAFVNQAEERGMKHKGQSWTGSFADYDNDGDQDCLITNHDVAHALMRNDGTGHFTEHILNIPLTATFAFQSLWADFDNNGFIDFLITGADKTYFYLNQDGENFIRLDQVFETTLNSASLGDLNDDGFIDIASYYGIGINLPGPIRDELYINKGNANHYFKFGLRGDASNAQGIGAKLELYGPWGLQTREVHAGLSYGVSNSLIQHFGCGPYTMADSLVVRWPSGLKEKYDNVSADDTYLIQEGLCMTERIHIQKNKDVLCPGEAIQLKLPVSFASYLWSDGSTTQDIIISEGGIYRAEMQNGSGCLYFSDVISVQKGVTNEAMDLQTDSLFLCEGEPVTIQLSDGYTSPLWSNGSTATSVEVGRDGWLSVQATDICGSHVADSVYIKLVAAFIRAENDTVKIGETANLMAEGQNLKWYSDVDKNKLIHAGSTLTIVNVQDDMTYYVEGSQTAGLHYGMVGEMTLATGNQYASNNVDAGLYLNAFQDLTLHSFIVGTDLAGVRRFLLINYAGDTLFSKDVFINANVPQIVEFDVDIPAGTYYQLKTDHRINKANFGFDGPRFIRTTNAVNYPYEVPGIMEIPTSTKGPTSYYYFYRLSLSFGGIKCYSGLYPVNVVVDRGTGSLETRFVSFILYPNPAFDHLTIQTDGRGHLTIRDMMGKQVVETFITRDVTHMDLTGIVPGVYLVSMGNLVYKVVIGKS